MTARSTNPPAPEFDAARFHALVERFATSLRASLRRYLPEQDLGDVVHDAVVCAYAHADRLPADPEAALKDLVRIGFTVADSVRRRTRLASLRFLSTGELLADVPDPREVAQWVEDRLIAFNALRAVNQPFRDVLELHLLDGLSYLEIAEEKNIPPGTARAWLWRGKSELAAAARPKTRKARRALIIPLGLGELDPMDRALFRALRDATRGDPAFGGGDGGEPPRPNSRPVPVAPRPPAAPHSSVAPYVFGGFAAVGGVAALVAALLLGSPSPSSSNRNSPAPARLFTPHALATASGVVIHSGSAPAVSPQTAPTAYPPTRAPTRPHVPARAEAPLGTVPLGTIREDATGYVTSRPAYDKLPK